MDLRIEGEISDHSRIELVIFWIDQTVYGVCGSSGGGDKVGWGHIFSGGSLSITILGLRGQIPVAQNADLMVWYLKVCLRIVSIAARNSSLLKTSHLVRVACSIAFRW
jgi:hypothetical protein